MSEAKQLAALGAETVGGNMYLRRVPVGVFRNGAFIITPEGRLALDQAAAKAGKPRKARPAKEEAAKDEAPAEEPLDTSDLDALLE